MSATTRRALADAVAYLFLMLTFVVSVFPFYWMFVLATRTTADTNRFPPVVVPGGRFAENVGRVFENIDFFRALANTVVVATVDTAATLFFSSLAAFALAFLRFRGRQVIFWFIVGTMMLPNALGVVPLYLLMTKLGWVNSLKAVVVPGLVSAFGVFWMKQYAEQAVHPELIESARMDGCGNFATYARIVLPLLAPGLATLGLLSFMFCWNDFVWPLIVLKDDAVITIQIALRKLVSVYYRDNAMIMAGTFLATLPLLVAFLLFNRHIVAGATEGAVKG